MANTRRKSPLEPLAAWHLTPPHESIYSSHRARANPPYNSRTIKDLRVPYFDPKVGAGQASPIPQADLSQEARYPDATALHRT
jgi:hypothetical protein